MSSQKLVNIFPVNKLATAMAWHEESIREENEFAENDEAAAIYANNQSDANNAGIQSVRSSASSKRQMQNEAATNQGINKDKGKAVAATNGYQRNNKMRTSNEAVV